MMTLRVMLWEVKNIFYVYLRRNLHLAETLTYTHGQTTLIHLYCYAHKGNAPFNLLMFQKSYQINNYTEIYDI